MSNEIQIQKKKLKGEDGHKLLTIRIPMETYDKISEKANDANMSKNELVNILLEEALKIVVIK